MRFRLTYNLLKKETGAFIPINYQYFISSWIYKVMDKGNPEIASWLHQQGFEAENKHFRLFTFSRLEIPKVKRVEDNLEILSPDMSVIISFYAEKISVPFIQGLFQDVKFMLNSKGNKIHFKVVLVEKIKDPVFTEEMTYRCLSPIHIAYRNNRNNRIDYLHPDHREYENLIAGNLISKWSSINKNSGSPFTPENIKLKVLSEPKKNGILIKEGRSDATKLIGYNFDFTLKAPVELQKAGYYAGFGKANSMGFGCGEALNQTGNGKLSELQTNR